MRARELLGQVLAGANLAEPDGRPLYGYKTVDSLLGAIAADLREQLGWGTRLNTFSCAAFCLFGAETFCNTHVGGPWRWAPIRDPIGFQRGWAELYDIVDRGLAWWRRDLIPGRQREYLFTLACEGGLPLQLVQNESSRLKEYLGATLQLVERYPEQAIGDLVRRERDRLPQTLRVDAVFELTEELLTVLVPLRKVLTNLDGGVAALDTVEPGWQRRVPLRLDDAVAVALVQGLLERPPTSREPAPAVRLDVRLSLSARRIELHPIVEPEISEAGLSAALGVEAANLPFRGQLELVWAPRSRLALATIVRLMGSDYRVTSRAGTEPITDRSALEQALHVTMTQSGGRQVGWREVPGGEPLPSESPWVFQDQTDRPTQRLLGVGAVRTSDTSALVILPDDAEVDPSPGASVEEVPWRIDSRRVVRATGTIHVRAPDHGSFRVVTGTKDDESIVFSLRGRSRPFGRDGSDAWLGAPSIVPLNREGEALPPVPGRDVLWKFPRDESGWRPLSDDCWGDVMIQVVQKGQVILRRRLTVLPRNFDYSLKPGRSEGRIILKGFPVLEASLVSADAGVTIALEPAQEAGTTILRFKSTGNNSASVELRFLLHNQTECVLCLPLPLEGARFVRTPATDVGLSMDVPISEIGAFQAEAFASDPNAKYDILNRGRVLSSLQGIPEGSRGHFVLPLAHIRSQVLQLLVSLDPDERVDLEIERRGLVVPKKPTLRVRRHDFTPETRDLPTGDTEILLRERSPVLDEAALPLVAEARPLLYPEADPEKLEPIDEDGRCGWLFPGSRLAPGPWLITCWQGKASRMRPLCKNVGHADLSALPEFDRAARLASREERADALSQHLIQMEGRADHADWRRLGVFAAQMEFLPANTYEVLRCLATRPLSAVYVLQRVGYTAFDAVYGGLETLPFSWVTVPLRTWIASTRLFVSFWDQALRNANQDPRPVIEQLLSQFAERISLAHPAGLTIGRMVVESYGNDPARGPTFPPESNESVATFWRQWGAARGKLLTAQADSRWPNSEWVDRGSTAPDLDKVRGEQPRHQWRVISAPYLAAWASVMGEEIPSAATIDLRLLRTFDDEWFHTAYDLAFRRLLGHQLRTNPRYLHA